MTSIIIPYRDRETHLSILIPKLAAVLPDAEVLVIEQGDSKPFNRGKLLNIGQMESIGDYIMFHDVDMVPVNNYPPPMTNAVTQVANSTIQIRSYLGGVTIFPAGIFELVGGYHNEYWHRAEDNEMRFNLDRFNIPVHNRIAVFTQLEHTRPAVEFDPVLWKKAQQPREVQDQLSICQYEITETTRHDYYTKITVNL